MLEENTVGWNFCCCLNVEDFCLGEGPDHTLEKRKLLQLTFCREIVSIHPPFSVGNSSMFHPPFSVGNSSTQWISENFMDVNETFGGSLMMNRLLSFIQFHR